MKEKPRSGGVFVWPDSLPIEWILYRLCTVFHAESGRSVAADEVTAGGLFQAEPASNLRRSCRWLLSQQERLRDRRRACAPKRGEALARRRRLARSRRRRSRGRLYAHATATEVGHEFVRSGVVAFLLAGSALLANGRPAGLSDVV